MNQCSQLLRNIEALYAGFDPEEENIEEYDSERGIAAKKMLVRKWQGLVWRVRGYILDKAEPAEKALFESR